MVLEIPDKILGQRDVRETPISTATATSLSVIDATYLTLSNHADLTDERVLTAGEGIDFNDAGAGNALTISGEDASLTNKGIIEVATVAETNTGTDAGKAVSPDGLDGWTGSAQLLHTNITAGDGSDHSLLANKTSYLSISPVEFSAVEPDNDLTNKGDSSNQALQNDVTFYAGVNLPHGAVVTGVILYGNAGAAADPGNWTFRRNAHDAGGTDAMASARIDVEDTSISNATIDNENYTYTIFSPSLDTNDRIHGARITYTTDYD